MALSFGEAIGSPERRLQTAATGGPERNATLQAPFVHFIVCWSCLVDVLAMIIAWCLIVALDAHSLNQFLVVFATIRLGL